MTDGKQSKGSNTQVSEFKRGKEREAARQHHGAFTSVYVKHLSEEQCEEGALRAMFEAYRPIASVFVPRHKDGTPKRFAFVNFASPKMAHRAVIEMHGRTIGGVARDDSAVSASKGARDSYDRSEDANEERKPLYVCQARKKSERESKFRKQSARGHRQQRERWEGCNVYVKHLSPEVDNRVLRAHFAPMGRITSCIVMRDSRGLSRGFGFVCFATKTEASKAVQKRNRTFLASKQLHVAIAQRKEVRPAHVRAKRDGIAPGMTVTAEAAPRTASDREEMLMTTTILSPGAMHAQPIAFVNFASPETGPRAVAEMHGGAPTIVIRNDSAGSASKGTRDAHDRNEDANEKCKPLYVCRTQKKSKRKSKLRKKSNRARRQQAERLEGRNVYVKHLSPEVDNQILRAHFAPMGRITSCVVMRDTRGLSRGFGFVCFATKAQASKAVEEMNRTLLASKQLHVAIDKRKELRPVPRQAQHSTLVPSDTASAGVGVLTMDAFPPLSTSVLL